MQLCFHVQHNNLKKIQRSVMDYYKQVLHVSLEKFSQPDLSKIGETPMYITVFSVKHLHVAHIILYMGIYQG